MIPIVQMKTLRLREVKGLAKVTELGRATAAWSNESGTYHTLLLPPLPRSPRPASKLKVLTSLAREIFKSVHPSLSETYLMAELVFVLFLK